MTVNHVVTSLVNKMDSNLKKNLKKAAFGHKRRQH